MVDLRAEDRGWSGGTAACLSASIIRAWIVCAISIAILGSTTAARGDDYGPDFCRGYLKVWTNDTCQQIADTFPVTGETASCVAHRRAYATFHKGFGFSIWLEMSNTCHDAIEVHMNVHKDDGSPDRYAYKIDPGQLVRESHFGYRNKQPFRYDVVAQPWLSGSHAR